MSSNLVYRPQPLYPADSPAADAGGDSNRLRGSSISALTFRRVGTLTESTRFTTSITDGCLLIVLPSQSESCAPRTPLGKRLAALSARARESGLRSMTADEILEEVKRRRGEQLA